MRSSTKPQRRADQGWRRWKSATITPTRPGPASASAHGCTSASGPSGRLRRKGSRSGGGARSSAGSLIPGRVGVIVADFHRRHLWSARRWGFVLERMGASCDATLVGSLHDIAEALAGRELVATATLNPGYRELLAGARAQLAPAPRFFDNPREPCSSFSKFWLRVQPKAGV